MRTHHGWRKEMKTITRSEELQLIGLQTLATGHVKALGEIEIAACAITRQNAYSGSHTGDMLWGNRTVPELLALLEITVAEDAPKSKEEVAKESYR